MALQQGTVDFLLDQMARAGTLSKKKMFGEYGAGSDFVGQYVIDKSAQFWENCTSTGIVKRQAAHEAAFSHPSE